MDQESLATLLKTFQSDNNEARKSAEEQFDRLCQDKPAWTMHALVELCAVTEDTALSNMCLITLRQLVNMEFNKTTAFRLADAETQNAVRVRLLQVLTTAAFGPQHGSAAACVSAVAVNTYGMQQNWPELWDNVFTILGSPESPQPLKTVCCEILSSSVAAMPDFFTPQLDQLAKGLINCLAVTEGGPDQCLTLWVSALTVVGRYTSAVDKHTPQQVAALSSVIQPTLELMRSCLDAQQSDAATDLLSVLTECIDAAAWVVGDHVLLLLQVLMEVASTAAIPAETRCMAIEALLSYCEGDHKSVRKIPQFATSFFQLLFQYMLNPVYLANWDIVNEDNDDEADAANADFITGRSGLDRLSRAIGGRKLQRTADELFRQNIASSDWQCRNAAVTLITYCMEGMIPVFSKKADQLVAALVPLIADENKYVRASTLDCFSQMCVDLGESVQPLHAQFLPPAIAAMRDPVPAVLNAAAGVLDSFFECTMDTELDPNSPTITAVAPYVQPLCEAGVAALGACAIPVVRRSVLGALSAVSNTCKAHLSPFVDELAPRYRELLGLPDTPELTPVKCKALECLTVLACGVGAQRFAPYTTFTCEYLANICRHGLTNADERMRFVLRGWTCMVECLMQQTAPYVDVLIPALLQIVDTECEMIVVDADDTDDDEDAADADQYARFEIVVPGVGVKVAKFHSGLIEDKALAASTLSTILSHLGVMLEPYFYRIATSAVELLDFAVNDEIRESGAQLLLGILREYKKVDNTVALQQVTTLIIPKLLAALHDERTEMVMIAMLEATGLCIGANPSCVTEAQATEVGTKLVATLQVLLDKRAKLQAKQQAEQDEDELDDLQDAIEETEVYIHSCCDVAGIMLRDASNFFGGYFGQHILPVASSWISTRADKFTMSRAFGLLSDFAEYAPAQLPAQVVEMTANLALEVVSTQDDAAMVQTAAFFLNIALQRFPTGIPSVVVPAAQAVGRQLSAPHALTEPFSHATCNLVSLLAVLIEQYALSGGDAPLAAGVNDMLTTLVSFLPANSDEIEARRVHDRVMHWCAQQAAPVAPFAEQIATKLRSAASDCLSDEAKQALQIPTN